MTELKNVYYADERDIDLIKKGIDYNIWLMCGNDVAKQRAFKEYFASKCSKVCVVDKNKEHPILDSYTLGYCCSDEEQNYTVEFYGYSGLEHINDRLLIHESTHEFCHAMQHVASYVLRDRNLDYIYDNVKYSVHGGNILEEKISNNDGNKYSCYGSAFCETITDLLTYIEILYLDPGFTSADITADDVLKKSHKILLPNSNLISNGYTMYLSIARLAIVAFSNNAYLSYDEIIKSGSSIITKKTKTRNNEIKLCNDLLYGIMCDARHVEESYDKYMGNNKYYELCSKFDDLLKNNILDSNKIKEIMISLAQFHNKKIQSQIGDGSISQNDALKMINDFNIVFNEMQKEYDSIFEANDILTITNSMKFKQKIKI